MNNRENAFDFLRLFAAFSVIVGHATAYFNTNFLWLEPGGGLWFYDRVPLFFILSGFFLYKSCDRIFRENTLTKEYFLKRFLRIVPGLYFYLIVTIISFWIFGVLTKEDLNGGFLSWVASTLFLIPVYHPSIFGDFGVGAVNGSLWTIPVEVSFYLTLPLFIYLKYKSNFKTMIGTMIAVALVAMISYKLLGQSFVSSEPPIWYKLIGVSVLPNLYYFTVGVVFAGIWGRLKPSLPKVIVTLIIYIFSRHVLTTESNTILIIFDIISVVSLGYITIWFGYNASKVFYKLTNKLGDLSYGIYIWHMVVINYFLFWNVHEKVDGTLLIVLVIVVTFIFGWISWHFVEKPAMKLKNYTFMDIKQKYYSIYNRTRKTLP